MHIGLIGGIGPAATDYYYRSLIESFALRGQQLELSIAHADAPTLLRHLADNKVDEQVAIYLELSSRLKAAGADCVVVTSIAGHFCIEPFKQQSPLEVIDMLGEVDREISSRQLQRVGILGTRTVMASRFYGGINTAEVIPPEGELLDAVHEAYAAMAMKGQANDEQRAVFNTACAFLLNKSGADSIMLGGTDLALVYSEKNTDFPLVDCAAIHVNAIVRRATS